MRTAVRQAIITDPTLVGLGVVPEGVLAGDIDTPAVRPFLNLKWGARSPGFADQTPWVLVIWVHDDPNDYTLVDQLCGRLRTLLPSLEGVADTEDGGWVNQIRWDGESDDLKDEGHNTITRRTTFTIIGS